MDSVDTVMFLIMLQQGLQYLFRLRFCLLFLSFFIHIVLSRNDVPIIPRVEVPREKCSFKNIYCTGPQYVTSDM